MGCGSISRSIARNRSSCWSTLFPYATLFRSLGISISNPGLISHPISREFSCGTRKQRFHQWSSTYHLTVPQIDPHYHGVAYDSSTAWFVFLSVLDGLRLDFALHRTQSVELLVYTLSLRDSLPISWDQHFKPGTHLPPNFPRIFVWHEEAAISPMVLHIPSDCSTNRSALPRSSIRQ